MEQQLHQPTVLVQVAEHGEPQTTCHTRGSEDSARTPTYSLSFTPVRGASCADLETTLVTPTRSIQLTNAAWQLRGKGCIEVDFQPTGPLAPICAQTFDSQRKKVEVRRRGWTRRISASAWISARKTQQTAEAPQVSQRTEQKTRSRKLHTYGAMVEQMFGKQWLTNLDQATTMKSEMTMRLQSRTLRQQTLRMETALSEVEFPDSGTGCKGMETRT